METPGEESIRDKLRQSLIYLDNLFICFIISISQNSQKIVPICRNPFRIETLYLVSIEI